MVQYYISMLRQRYPLADPPSLIASFLILHELTAIVPLGIGFFALKRLGVGESLVKWTIEGTQQTEPTWAAGMVRKWAKEGSEQAERIGRRYGTFGFEKETKEAKDERKRIPIVQSISLSNTGGDVANLVASYLLVKVSSSVSSRSSQTERNYLN
jgi:hypothetical protein